MKTIESCSAQKRVLCLLALLAFAVNASARVFVATNSTWRYFKGTNEASIPTNAWRQLDFDDSAWLVGAAPFHYGTNAAGGDDTLTGGTILSDMRSNYTCIFLRQTFTVPDTNMVLTLNLGTYMDDGLVAWINGVELPRQNAPYSGELSHTNTARSSLEASRRTVSIASFIGALRNGTNVLAVQALNVHSTNDDFRIDVELAETPSTLQFSATSYPVQEVGGQVLMRVLRTNSLEGGVTMDYATTNGTALAGADYVATNGTLAFAEGQTEQTIAVAILNDALHENTESFQVNLSNPGGGAVLGTVKSAAVTITDNDPGFEVEFSNYWVHEDAGPVVIGVLRGCDGDYPATVDFATSNGSAVAGSDFVGTNGTLSFGLGEALKLVAIPILNDGVREGQESFTFTLRNPGGGAVLGTVVTATVTLYESDLGVSFGRTQHWVHEHEGELRVTVLRGNDQQLGAFTVEFATSNLTATAGQDYLATNGTLAFAEGEMQQTFAVRILNDAMLEADEQFRVMLTNVTEDATLSYPANTTATVTICDATGTKPHGFKSLQVSNDGTVQLTLEGGVSKRFEPFFDLYPIEVSSNLVDWVPLVTLQRTNASTNALVYTDPEAAKFGMRFYRTVTNHLITSMLKPTGPYSVGIVSRLLTDATRRNRYHISTNGSFMISIWYPAVPEAGKLPAGFEDAHLAEDCSPGLTGAIFPSRTAELADRQPYFRSQALPDARWATAPAPHPIVLNSPGGMTPRYDESEKASYLASHGYVVVSVDHWDAYGTVFPDGTYLHGITSLSSLNPTTAGFQDRLMDLRFVLDELGRWNTSDPMFAGRLDLMNVATVGMSWGGGVAGEMARSDPRCRAAIILDGYFQNADALLQNGLPKPFLSLYSDPSGKPGYELLLFNNPATRNAIWFQVSATIHQQFFDYYWLYWLAGASTVPTGQEVERIFNAYGLWFLNKHLKGIDDPMPAITNFPRVINFKQK